MWETGESVIRVVGALRFHDLKNIVIRDYRGARESGGQE